MKIIGCMCVTNRTPISPCFVSLGLIRQRKFNPMVLWLLHDVLPLVGSYERQILNCILHVLLG